MSRPITEPEFAVPDGEQPPARCPHCDRPFRSEELYVLHLGEVHPEECTPAEREAYEEAYDAESHDLFTFHAKVVVALTLLFFAFAYTYAVVWN